MTQYFSDFGFEVVYLQSKVLALELSQCFRMVSSSVGLSDLLVSDLTDVGDPLIVQFISLDFRVEGAHRHMLTSACLLCFFACDTTSCSKLALKTSLLNSLCVKTLTSFFLRNPQVLPVLTANLLHGGLVSRASYLSNERTCVGLDIQVVLLLVLVGHID